MLSFTDLNHATVPRQLNSNQIFYFRLISIFLQKINLKLYNSKPMMSNLLNFLLVALAFTACYAGVVPDAKSTDKIEREQSPSSVFPRTSGVAHSRRRRVLDLERVVPEVVVTPGLLPVVETVVRPAIRPVGERIIRRPIAGPLRRRRFINFVSRPIIRTIILPEIAVAPVLPVGPLVNPLFAAPAVVRSFGPMREFVEVGPIRRHHHFF
jgi:hypothetical protein